MKKFSETFNEAILSTGLVNSLRKQIKYKGLCPHCGLAIPTYPGKYPNECPICHKELVGKPAVISKDDDDVHVAGEHETDDETNN